MVSVRPLEALTDRGIAMLARVPELARLDLYGTGITDKGLMSLLGSPKLSYISLHGCQHLSRQAVLDFQRRKHCHIDIMIN